MLTQLRHFAGVGRANTSLGSVPGSTVDHDDRDACLFVAGYADAITPRYGEARFAGRVGRPDGGGRPGSQAGLFELAAQSEDHAAGVRLGDLRLREPDENRSLPAGGRGQVRLN